MKLKYVLTVLASLVLLCALCTAPASVLAADNLAANGDLELGTTNGWEIDSAAIDSTVTHGGSYSLKLTATSAYSGAAYKAIPLRKNATVTVSFWYRYAENPSGKLYHVYTYKGDNPWTGVYSGAEASFAATSSNYTTWKQATYTFNSGDYEAIYLKFCPAGTGSVPCYIDDLVVTSEGGDEPDVAPYLTSFGTKMNRPKDAASNLLVNGGFESTASARWNTSTFIKGNLSVVEDTTAPEGTHSLCLSYTALSVPTWYYFPVTVEKNTRYTFSAWVKSPRLSAANDATATFGVMDSTTSFLVYDEYNGNGHGSASLSTTEMQLMATAPDDEWHLRSVAFDSGSHTTLYIGVYGTRSCLYLDDMALFKSSNGVEYISPLRSDAIASAANGGNKYCADADSLVEGIDMASNDAQLYWSDNPAWRNGFLSFVEDDAAHGTALQYSQSAHPEWALHYIKWIDVTPHTDYTFTADVKRLAAGGGRIALLDDNALSPAELYTVSFDTVDGDWATYSVTFNSGVYSRIGICIVDGGGSALIDEVRLFESAKGIADKPAADPTLKPVGVGTSVMEMETVTPTNLMLNGGFENGVNSWDIYQSTTVTASAAYSGGYGAHLQGGGTWGALIEQRGISVENGNTYTLSFRYKANTGGANVTLFGTQTNTQYAYVWAAAGEWTTFTATFTVAGDTTVWLNACGGGNGVAEDIYLDEVSLLYADDTAKLGVAFLIEQEGFRIYKDSQSRVDLSAATVVPYGDGEAYTLLRMGAIMTNNAAVGTDASVMTLAATNNSNVIDVPVVYLWSVEEDRCEYAVRVTNVPANRADTLIYTRPYYVFEKDGEEIVVYGDILSRSYNG